MNPGKLNRKINILKPDQISDGAGGYEDSFVPVKTVWGSVKSIFGRERMEAMQVQAEVTHKITIRYTEDVNRSHVVSFNGTKYNIQYIININEENKFLELSVLRRD